MIFLKALISDVVFDKKESAILSYKFLAWFSNFSRLVLVFMNFAVMVSSLALGFEAFLTIVTLVGS